MTPAPLRLSVTAALALLVPFAGLAQAQPRAVHVPDGRIEQVAVWLKSVARHVPGQSDEASDVVSGWSNEQLQGLWVEVSNLVALMRHTDAGRFVFTPVGSRNQVLIDYTPLQLARLRAFACAGAGLLNDDAVCIRIRAAESVGDELRALAIQARMSRDAGDPNYTIRRGALMHADIAMAGPLSKTPVDTRPSLAPQSFLMRTSDGQSQDFGQVAIHWEIGRMLLDDVRPKGAMKPSPSTDEMVRLWYRSTAAWMQKGEHLNKTHLGHARQIFPHDADILFLLGCLHETFADAQVQSAIRSTVLPSDVVMDMQDERTELKLAEDILREALAARPEDAETRMRFGRVVSLRGRYAEAVSEIGRAIDSMSEHEEAQQYYAQLFLGAALEGAGRFEESRTAYQRAVVLFPKAQSPLLGLSELAQRQGDRRSALEAMQQMFDLPSLEDERLDPWWGYHVYQARNADRLLSDLWKPFRGEATPR
jgi:hypothetical protein